MDEIQYSIKPGKTTDRVFIQCRKDGAPVENELGVIQRNVQLGFIEVNPSKAAELLEKLEQNELSVIFGAKDSRTGLHTISVHSVEVAVEAA